MIDFKKKINSFQDFNKEDLRLIKLIFILPYLITIILFLLYPFISEGSSIKEIILSHIERPNLVCTWDGISWTNDIRVDTSSTQLFTPSSYAVPSTSTIFTVFTKAIVLPNHVDLYFTKSTDNGATWSTQIEIYSQGLLIATPSLMALDVNNIFVVFGGHDSSGANNRTMFGKSTDGGTNWSYVQLNTTYGIKNSIYVLDIDTIFMTYDNNSGTITFQKSINGGTTWSSGSIITTDGKSSQDRTIWAIDANTIYVIYHGKSVWSNLYFAKSTDGGTTWSSLLFETASSAAEIYLAVVDTNTIYVTYQDTSTHLHFAKSTNGGTTWTTTVVESTHNDRGAAIAAYSANKIVIVYWDITDSRIKTAYSNNAGVTWTITPIPSALNNTTSWTSMNAISNYAVYVTYLGASSGNEIHFSRTAYTCE